ncbi:hypothetical protein GGR54DRAFT_212733 [Hypoxylon sp. NC1633]|nr:hypothetical protein GGR54DRAFT_212733 [Hypoxylon sp. NC1633]
MQQRRTVELGHSPILVIVALAQFLSGEGEGGRVCHAPWTMGVMMGPYPSREASTGESEQAHLVNSQDLVKFGGPNRHISRFVGEIFESSSTNQSSQSSRVTKSSGVKSIKPHPILHKIDSLFCVHTLYQHRSILLKR